MRIQLEEQWKALRPAHDEAAEGSLEKAVLAWWLRENTTVAVRWVSQRLEMGHYTRVTQAISRVARRPSRKRKTIIRKMTGLTEKMQEQP